MSDLEAELIAQSTGSASRCRPFEQGRGKPHHLDPSIGDLPRHVLLFTRGERKKVASFDGPHLQRLDAIFVRKSNCLRQWRLQLVIDERKRMLSRHGRALLHLGPVPSSSGMIRSNLAAK